ncbi:TPA: DUF4299 family protein [Streptococcus equi subsp. zooepidemicus]|uniref:DUF4299 family protein n=1 Tax=Streptococcus equi TaxID=1336 RepID=UPI0005BE51AE|nr:DUF4299 family protein [Streptococcus equi]KIS16080.1 hypothetical protein AT48_01865 [Streptococcus equi subsp. zooepidemicus SzAM60]HEL0641263.1 DUF4299 family protein [Streptococcus equi subsp. zooepidemicus]HEL1179016.1 DUF4299 family protein [Streptococcus equi subsp. zooepidemicus]HEL1236126.1 DUF4299 family protein [Streptococcus equi subsp. zooepidemicus]
MDLTTFTLTSPKELSIDNLLQSELFECVGIIFKSEDQNINIDSQISSFQTVKFAVKSESTFGFDVSKMEDYYNVVIPPLATESDWIGALMFLKMLMVILEVPCQQGEQIYDVATIEQFHFGPILLRNIQQLVQRLKEVALLPVEGIRRTVYFNMAFLDQILSVPNEHILESYDTHLKLTQHIQAYFSEQQVFRLEQNNDANLVVVNYLNNDRVTVLPSKPELAAINQQYQNNEHKVVYLIVTIDRNGERLNEENYADCIARLSKQTMALDGKLLVVKPEIRD